MEECGVRTIAKGVLILVVVATAAGCVLNPTEDYTLAGTTWELDSLIAGVSPQLFYDYIPLGSQIIAEFNGGSASFSVQKSGETIDTLGGISYELNGDAITVTRGNNFVTEGEYVVTANDRRMECANFITYYTFKAP